MNGSTTNDPPATVVDSDGLEGTIIDWPAVTESEPMLLVLFENGERVLVPRQLLTQQPDGRYRLMASIEQLLSEKSSIQSRVTQNQVTESQAIEYLADEKQTLVLPVIAEKATVHKLVVEKGRVEIHKTVHERTEVVDPPLLMEEVEIERVPINRIIDAHMVDEAVSIRHEGDTTIIPLFEEVLVIEKRLVLREEVHIKKLQTVVHAPQEVRLREERVDIVRNPNDAHS